MSGHSKWSTIKRQKGANDAKRGQTFTKLANTITLAAKLGNSGDPESNPRLRLVIEEARGVNMPKENIQRAIDRGLGKLPGQTIEEVSYEGFGPGKVAFLIEGITDNKMRTTSEMKNLFDRSGGNLGAIGSTAYMFDKVGQIQVMGKGEDQTDSEILELIDAGAEDVEDFIGDGRQKYIVYSKPEELNQVTGKIKESGFEVESSDIAYKPNLMVNIADKETAQKILGFTERLEDRDDVQKVYANFDIPDSLMGE